MFIRGNKDLPRNSPRLESRRGLGRLIVYVLCLWGPTPASPHPQPQERQLAVQLSGQSIGEGTKKVPTPVHKDSSSSLAPEPPLRPCPSPCCAVSRTWKESRQQAPQREGIAHGFQNRIDESPGPRPGSPGPQVRRLSFRDHTFSWGEGNQRKEGPEKTTSHRPLEGSS